MNEVRILTVEVEDVLEHAEDETGDGENFAKGAKAELAGDGNE